MGIRQPRINLAENDKKLLAIIAAHLLEKSSSHPTNLPSSHIALSNHEAEKLLNLLNTLVQSPQFSDARAFVKSISNSREGSNKITRTIQTTALKRIRPDNIITHHRLYELQARLGIKNHKFMGKEILPISVPHFFKMEKRLFEELEFHPQVTSLLMKLGEQQTEIIAKYLELGYGPTVDLILPLNSLRQQVNKEGIASRINLSAAAFVVANCATLFSSRDWAATGVLSCIIGNAISTFAPNRNSNNSG